jgi:amino acid adenylation domain-containing protein
MRQHGESSQTLERTLSPIIREFQFHVQEQPSALAVMYPGPKQRPLTYGALDLESESIATHLAGQGVRPGDRVAVVTGASELLISTILGIAKTGAAYVLIDPKLPPARIEQVLSDSRPRAVIANGLVQRDGERRPWSIVESRDLLANFDTPVDLPPMAGAGPDAPLYLCYTSGTTGVPKAAVIPQRAVANLVSATPEIAVESDDIVLQASAPSFDAFTFEVWSALMAGASLIGVSRDVLVDSREFSAFLSAHQVTVVCLTTSVFTAVALEAPEAIGRLRLAVFGGEAANVAAVRSALKAKPGRLVNGYGPTEATTFSLCHVISALPDDAMEVPIGKAIGGCQIRIVGDDGSDVAEGEPGELLIGGQGLSLGYFEKPELTSASFVPDPRGTLSVVYRSGDIVRRDIDGLIRYVGRVDNQVKIRGHRVELEEVESHLAADPDVNNAAVILATDNTDSFLVAYASVTERASNSSMVDRWTSLYDELYVALDPSSETDLFRGWNSALDNLPIPLADMRVWRDSTLERIRALEPKSILEIGVGSGILLTALAPEVSEYWGTEISAGAIDNLQAHFAARPEGERVTLLRQEATDVRGLPPAHFDAIVLNSVVQYFPDGQYLTDALEALLPLLAPGGSVFIGDVKNLDTRDRLRGEAVDGARIDNELMVAPHFFAGFTAASDKLQSYQTHVKRGAKRNELTAYRYDVVLSTAPAPNSTCEITLPWAGQSLSEVAQILADYSDAQVHWSGPPDGRLTASPTAGFDIEDVYQLAQHHRRPVAVTPGVSPGTFDAIFAGSNSAEIPRRPAAPPSHSEFTATESVNSPLPATRDTRMENALLHRLRTKLPEYMVPSRIVVLDELPISVNGKIDRRRLPHWQTGSGQVTRTEDKPMTPLEVVVRDLFAEQLVRSPDEIGAETSFFDMGGHSLMAARLVNRIRAVLSTETSIAELYRAPTVRSFSSALMPRTAASLRNDAPSTPANEPTVHADRNELHIGVASTSSASALARHLGSTTPLLIEAAIALSVALALGRREVRILSLWSSTSGFSHGDPERAHEFAIPVEPAQSFSDYASLYTEESIDTIFHSDAGVPQSDRADSNLAVGATWAHGVNPHGTPSVVALRTEDGRYVISTTRDSATTAADLAALACELSDLVFLAPDSTILEIAAAVHLSHDRDHPTSSTSRLKTIGTPQ